MSTNLAGGVNIGELQACIVRAARLDSDCSPTGGVNGGIVTAALVTLTADPDIEEGTNYEQKNACGDILFTDPSNLVVGIHEAITIKAVDWPATSSQRIFVEMEIDADFMRPDAVATAKNVALLS